MIVQAGLLELWPEVGSRRDDEHRLGLRRHDDQPARGGRHSTNGEAGRLGVASNSLVVAANPRRLGWSPKALGRADYPESLR